MGRTRGSLEVIGPRNVGVVLGICGFGYFSWGGEIVARRENG